jgi:hypothetical protein
MTKARASPPICEGETKGKERARRKRSENKVYCLEKGKSLAVIIIPVQLSRDEEKSRLLRALNLAVFHH